MKASSVVQLGFLAAASLLTACGGECEAVEHSNGRSDTVQIAKTDGNCTVNAYSADSVGPKVK